MVHLVAMNQTNTAIEIALVYWNAVGKLHRIPRIVVSDRDPKFVSPSGANVSEALPVAKQGRPGRKCDLRHAGLHAKRKRVKPTPDRPPGMDGECTGQQCSGVTDGNASLRLLGDAGRCDGAARFTAPMCW